MSPLVTNLCTSIYVHQLRTIFLSVSSETRRNFSTNYCHRCSTPYSSQFHVWRSWFFPHSCCTLNN
ncbi:unnamed protein product [Ixodes persulcatus]